MGISVNCGGSGRVMSGKDNFLFTNGIGMVFCGRVESSRVRKNYPLGNSDTWKLQVSKVK